MTQHETEHTIFITALDILLWSVICLVIGWGLATYTNVVDLAIGEECTITDEGCN